MILKSKILFDDDNQLLHFDINKMFRWTTFPVQYHDKKVVTTNKEGTQKNLPQPPSS